MLLSLPSSLLIVLKLTLYQAGQEVEVNWWDDECDELSADVLIAVKKDKILSCKSMVKLCWYGTSSLVWSY